MALIACHECGARISDAADRCPHCGVAGKKASRLATMTAVLVLVTFVGWLLMAAMGS